MTVVPYLRFAARLKGLARGDVEAGIDRVLDTCGLAARQQPPPGASLEGLPPARRPGPGAHPRPRGADPRRAHDRARPAPDHRDPRAHPGASAPNRTVVLSTHILPEVQQVCDKVVIINDGRVVVRGHARQPDARPHARRGLHRRRSRAARDAWPTQRGPRPMRNIAHHRRARAALVLLVAGRVRPDRRLPGAGGLLLLRAAARLQPELAIYSMMRNPEMLAALQPERDGHPARCCTTCRVLLIFIVPAITMRMFPEEKRAGTYELLLTSPVRIERDRRSASSSAAWCWCSS